MEAGPLEAFGGLLSQAGPGASAEGDYRVPLAEPRGSFFHWSPPLPAEQWLPDLMMLGTTWAVKDIDY